MNETSVIRSGVAGAAVVLALFSGCWFYGSGINLVALWVSCVLLLAGCILVGPRMIAEPAGGTPSVALPLGALAALFVGHQFSQAPEVGVPPSWVLACLPLSFLVVASLDASGRRLVVRGVYAVGIAMACISTWLFLVFRERAGLPLPDPTTYGILLYLIWIPWLHGRLCRHWAGERDVAVRRLLEYGATAVFVVAIVATESRACTAVVGVALGVWLAVVLWRRLDWHPVALHAGLALGAALLVLGLNATSDGGMLAEQASDLAEPGTDGVAIRMAMVGSAWQMFLAHPVVGAGVFGFSVLYPASRSLVDQETAGLYVHNDYVQLLAEGGILLVPFALAFVGFALRRFFSALRRPPANLRFQELGLAMALVAACLHANVNFVFYSLPLAILLGTLAALTVRHDRARAPRARSAAPVILYAGTLVLGGIALAVLTVEWAMAGMLTGQRYVPFVAAARADPAAVLSFSRSVQRIFPSRSVPVLAEARILDDLAATNPRFGALALDAHRRAIDANPYNPVVYRAMAQHLSTVPHPQGTLRAGESVEPMLLRSVSVDPLYYPGIDALLAVYDQTGAVDSGYELLRELVLPRLVLIKVQDDARARRYAGLLEAGARQRGDQETLDTLTGLGPQLAGLHERKSRYWLFDPAG